MNGTILLLLVVIRLVPTILQMRRQRQRLTELQNIQSSVQPGDMVVTTSGVHATVVATREATVTLMIAPGVETVWERSAIIRRTPASAPAETLPAESSDGPSGE